MRRHRLDLDFLQQTQQAAVQYLTHVRYGLMNTEILREPVVSMYHSFLAAVTMRRRHRHTSPQNTPVLVSDTVHHDALDTLGISVICHHLADLKREAVVAVYALLHLLCSCERYP